MLFPKLLFIGLTGVTSLSVHGQQAGSVKRIYVSTKGSDRNQGTMASPYATAEAALRSVEKQKQGKNTPGIEIIFMAPISWINRLNCLLGYRVQEGNPCGLKLRMEHKLR